MNEYINKRLNILDSHSLRLNDFPLSNLEVDGKIYNELESYDLKYVEWIFQDLLIVLQKIGIITRLDFIDSTKTENEMHKISEAIINYHPHLLSYKLYCDWEPPLSRLREFLMKFSVEDVLMEEIFKHHEFDSKTVECISKSEIKTLSEFHRLVKKCGNINYLQNELGLREYEQDDLDEIINYTNYLLIPGFDFRDAEYFCNTGVALFKDNELRDDYMMKKKGYNNEKLLWLVFCAKLLDFAWINHFVE